MFTRLEKIRQELLSLKDEANENCSPELYGALAGACVSMRAACGHAMEEGKSGTQESNRRYASTKETRGPEIGRKEDSLLDPKSSQDWKKLLNSLGNIPF